MAVVDNPVFIEGLDPDAIMSIVRDLRSHGMLQGIDFDFKYCPGEYQWSLYEDNVIKPKGAEFCFKDAKWATFFRMKYGT